MSDAITHPLGFRPRNQRNQPNG